MKLRLAIFAIAGLTALLIALAQSAPRALSSYDSQVKPLLSRMTLEEKVGQMTQPEQDALKDPADLENLFIGSVLSGGNSDPKEGNSIKAWTDLYNRIQEHS